MSLNVFIRRRIIWSSRIVRTMLEVSIFFSGFVTMATVGRGWRSCRVLSAAPSYTEAAGAQTPFVGERKEKRTRAVQLLDLKQLFMTSS
jgi:hypothetical protein